MTTNRRSFNSGIESAKVERVNFSSGPKTFTLAEDEQCYVQFFDNPPNGGWITVGVHNVIPTKAQPADHKGKWPRAMSAVCPNWRMEDGGSIREGGCYICESIVPLDEKRYKAKPRTFGLGLRRKRIYGDGSENQGGPSRKGKEIGWATDTVDMPKRGPDGKAIEGETTMAPRIEYFMQAWANFWMPIAAVLSAYSDPDSGVPGSITDQIFSLKKTGKGLDVSYNPVAIKQLKPERDLSNPEYAKTFGIMIDADGNKVYPEELDLYSHVMHLCSPEYFERFWIPASGPTVTGPSTSAPAANPGTDALRQRLTEKINAGQAKETPLDVGVGGVQLDLDLDEP